MNIKEVLRFNVCLTRYSTNVGRNEVMSFYCELISVTLAANYDTCEITSMVNMFK